MKLFFLLLITTQIYKFESEQESEEPAENEEEEDVFEIDTGCIKSRPSLCPDGICYQDYSYCKTLQGCTTSELPLMCPGGKCVKDFAECNLKTYKCAMEGQTLCSDGRCRKNCKQINSMGCSSKNPFYCPNGSCVKYEAQCLDYRCNLDKPFLCIDLSCVEKPFICPLNYTVILLQDTAIPLTINKSKSNKMYYNIFDHQNDKERVVKFNFYSNYLFYNEFTAYYQKLHEEGQDTIDISLNIKSFPKDILNKSKLLYEETDLTIERLTNRIFSKQFEFLTIEEFIRSPVIEVKIDEYEYGHFFFKDFPSVQILFNKIQSYPDMNLSKEEVDELNKDTGIPYNINDAENYYCLGIYDEVNDQWRCANRKIVDINENLIEYKIPFPGIYGVIYMPRAGDAAQTNDCEFVCNYRKNFFIIFLLIIPLSVLVYFYIYREYGSFLSEQKQKLKQFVKEKAFNEKKFDENQEESLILDNKEINISEIEGENFDIRGQIDTFTNPLVQTGEFQDNQKDIQELENHKMKLKYKRDIILKEKLGLIQKLSALDAHQEGLKTEIYKLKKLIGLNDLQDVN